MTIALAVGAAGTAGAMPPTEHGPEIEPVTALAGDGSFLTGYFEPRHFSVDENGTLSATGRLTGTISRSGALQTHVDEQITLPVDRQPSTGSCLMVDLAVGPRDVTLAGTPLHVDQTRVNVSMPEGPGSRLMVPLCAAGELMNGPPAQSNPGLRDLLNQMLSLLGQGG